MAARSFIEPELFVKNEVVVLKVSKAGERVSRVLWPSKDCITLVEIREDDVELPLVNKV